MGLDMYLMADLYVGGKWCHDDSVLTIADLTGYGRDISVPVAEISGIMLEVGYWRKMNAIHAWFVGNFADGVDDCKPMYVCIENLAELRTTCLEVLADHSKAGGLLPVADGFFFGATAYDEWYFEGLAHTVEVIERAVEMNGRYGGLDFYYQASW